MTKFDIVDIAGGLFLVVQAEHLLELGSIVIVPVLPEAELPKLRQLTVDVSIEGRSYRIRAHMPVTVETARLRQARVVHRLSPDEGQRVMDGLYTILWGL